MDSNEHFYGFCAADIELKEVHLGLDIDVSNVRSCTPFELFIGGGGGVGWGVVTSKFGVEIDRLKLTWPIRVANFTEQSGMNIVSFESGFRSQLDFVSVVYSWGVLIR